MGDEQKAVSGALSPLLARRSVSPKRLCAPGPARDALDSIIDAGLRAPDHGGLHPWRVIEFPADAREALADLFEAEKRARDPAGSADDFMRAREHATHAPVVLAFIVRPERHPLVPQHEQWLSAGAALGNMLMASHLLGFGAIMLSGERCQDAALREALGLQANEVLAGFLSIGTIAKAPPPARRSRPGAGVVDLERRPSETPGRLAARRTDTGLTVIYSMDATARGVRRQLSSFCHGALLPFRYRHIRLSGYLDARSAAVGGCARSHGDCSTHPLPMKERET